MTKQKITSADFANSPALTAHSFKSKVIARALDEQAAALRYSKVFSLSFTERLRHDPAFARKRFDEIMTLMRAGETTVGRRMLRAWAKSRRIARNGSRP